MDSFQFQKGFPTATAPTDALAQTVADAQTQAENRGYVVASVAPHAISADTEMLGTGVYTVTVTVNHE